MTEPNGPEMKATSAAEFGAYERDIRKAERKVAGEIDPGARGVVVAAGVLLAMLSLVLPHTGDVNAFDVLSSSEEADAARLNIVSTIFVYLVLIFAIGFSALALVTRRWVLAWIALCGTSVAVVLGVLAWWSRNTPGVGGIESPSGPHVGLALGILACGLLAFHWARVVWERSTYQLALEEERRKEAAEAEEFARSLQRRKVAEKVDEAVKKAEREHAENDEA